MLVGTSLRREGDRLLIFYLTNKALSESDNKVPEQSWAGGGEFLTRVSSVISPSGETVTDLLF